MKVLTFGCRLNSYESSLIQKIGEGLDNVILINTCAVTKEAERQCRQAIRKARKENPDAVIIAAGCAVQLNPERYLSMPEVDRVFGNVEKLRPEDLLSDKKMCVGDSLDEETANLPLVSDFEHRTRAFLQIQQGCSHACTFCVIPQIRGKNKGLEPAQILRQARAFTEKGYKELVLTGVDILSYPFGFEDLVKKLLHEVDGLCRLRLGSLDPHGVSDRLLSFFGEEEKLMPSVHLSAQAGDDMVLKRMGRRHNRAEVLRICSFLKKMNPDISIGSDFIAGFPTETEEMFLNTCRLVEEGQITHLHVFPYSERPGTPAAKMPQVAPTVRKQRAARLRRLGNKMMADYMEGFIGRAVEVLVETNAGGWTKYYLKAVMEGAAPEGAFVRGIVKEVTSDGLVVKA